MARWTGRLDWRQAIDWWPSQSPGLIEAAGLSRSQVESAAWAIDSAGRMHRGAAAILTALDQLLPRGLPLFSRPFRLPGLRLLADAGYVLVARNRHRLPGTAVCSIGAPPTLPEPWTETIVARRASRG